MRLCDMHLHSNVSDGSLSPRELAAAAAGAGLCAAILTDHDTVGGVKEFVRAARTLGVDGRAGIECSCLWGSHEVHILGLFLPEDSWETVNLWTESWKQGKIESNVRLAERLAAAGYPISYAEIKARFAGSRINRAHFAGELVRIGAASSVQDAFDRFLEEKNGFYVPAPKPTAEDVIRQILSWGGVPVLAHPVLDLSWDEIAAYLPWAKARGAVGAEVCYSEYSAEDTRRMEVLCREAGLLPGGGSDFHGAVKPHITVGCVPVPYALFEALEKESNQKGPAIHK